MSNLDPFRAAGNPLFNDNKLKLGVFGSNCSNACAMPVLTCRWRPAARWMWQRWIRGFHA